MKAGSYPSPGDGGVGGPLTLTVQLDVIVDLALVDGHRPRDERRRFPDQDLHGARGSSRPVDVERGASVLALDIFGHLERGHRHRERER